MEQTDKDTRCGFVALIGAPNAGKSTLLNQMVGEKVSIVSPKVQTTRARITAIAIWENAQIVFVDTPGIFRPRRRLDKAMVDAAWGGAGDADMVVLLVDAERGIGADDERIIEGLKTHKRKALLAINKIDTIRRDSLLELSARLNEMFPFEKTFMISALKGDGILDLKEYLAGRLPEGPWLYPEDQLALVPQRLLAAEITREKIYLRLHQELPYATTVETESWEERQDGSVKISQVIYVERPSQKAIVLGRSGRTIKALGAAARQELEEILDRRVHLFLFVKVRERWEDDPERYREMGLDFPGG